MKNTQIKQYLAKRGITPKTERYGAAMYLSPLRTERTPSFKVDLDKNLWYDFGIGEGGSIIDLVMRLENCSVADAFRYLENDSPIFSLSNALRRAGIDPEPKPEPKPKSPIQQITDVKPLTNRYLIRYLASRGIDLKIARKYCKEVHYLTRSHPYYAIGFSNDLGGYELRNKHYKGGTSPKGVTTFKADSPVTVIFEGFMDFLSYKTIFPSDDYIQNIVVLNSVTNLRKITDELANQSRIFSYLDNDKAGKTALETLRELPCEVIDCSRQFAPHKDLNDYLMTQLTPTR